MTIANRPFAFAAASTLACALAVSTSPAMTDGAAAQSVVSASTRPGISIRPAITQPADPVSTTPSMNTPYLDPSVPSQNVRQLVQCGDLMYAVGSFSSIISATGTTYVRHNAFSFSATTGAVTNWRPRLNGNVDSVALDPSCTRAYLGGTFTRVNGKPAVNFVAVGTGRGNLLGKIGHHANADVSTLQYTGGRVIAGGKFTSINGVARTMLASLDPTTGAVTAYADLTIAGEYPDHAVTRVYNSQVSHDGSRMLLEGIFTSINGKLRQQVAMLNLGADSATLSGWRAAGFHQQCRRPSFYAKSAAWSPTDNFVYVATTGMGPVGVPRRGERSGLCDAVSAFRTTPANVASKWVNYTGCDSLFSVAAAAGSVYIGGHERWENNSHDCNHAGRGAKPRQGVGSVGSKKGLATAWNPTRSRGRGADSMLVTQGGLWIGSDNGDNGQAQKCGGVTNHGGICFFPFAS